MFNLFTSASRDIEYENSFYYRNVYRRFMEEYDKGADTRYIAEQLLSEFHRGACDSEFLLHDVYFALAQAMWETGFLPDDILKIVGDIITSGSDLEYFRLKSFPETEISKRGDALNDLLCRLMLPNSSPRKRGEAAVGPPSFRIGDVFAYDDHGRRRLLIIADRVDRLPLKPMYFCCVPAACFDGELPFEDDLAAEELGVMGLMQQDDGIRPEELTFVMRMKIPPGRYIELFSGDWMFIRRKDLYGELHLGCRCTIKGLIECEPHKAYSFLPPAVRYRIRGDEWDPEF